MSLHRRALKKWEKVSIAKTGTRIQYFVVFKAVVNLSHSWGGICCKLHQISKMPIKKKKAIFRNLLIVVSFRMTCNLRPSLLLTWISSPKIPENGVVLIIDNLEGYCSLYDTTGNFLGNLELNESNEFNQPLTFVEIISSTGLQIKTDPGIPMIYSGFFFLMLSTLLSYITYSQIWLIQRNQKLFIGGTTNRAIFDFELEFLKLVK